METKGKDGKPLTEEESTKQMMGSFDNETSEAVRVLVEQTLIASYPDEGENEMKVFAMKYLMQLMGVVMKLYSTTDTKNVEQVKKIQHLQNIRQKQTETDAINQG